MLRPIAMAAQVTCGRPASHQRAHCVYCVRHESGTVLTECSWERLRSGCLYHRAAETGLGVSTELGCIGLALTIQFSQLSWLGSSVSRATV